MSRTFRPNPVLGSGPWPIGGRIRQLRGQKGLSQGDIENKTGLLRCYISRVENGFKMPSLGTLEKFAYALDVPLYHLFYYGIEPPRPKRLTSRPSFEHLLEAQECAGPQARFATKLRRLWQRMGSFEHQVLLDVARRMATRVSE
jgi:transcriptional regulator with XRE-family HTH domain